jgi:hypothetical protein
MRRSITALQLLLLIGLAGWAAPANVATLATPAPIVYIAPDGDDSQDCATPATRCATLQHGLDQLADDGEARLAAGSYAGTTNLNRPATISGGYRLPDFSPGATPAVLDGQRKGTTLRISGAIWARLERLTVTGGLADPTGEATGSGGGVSIRGAQVLLDHVEVSGNIACAGGSGRGGGIYIRDGGLTLTYSTVASNTAALLTTAPPTDPAGTIAGSGGGIYAMNARVTIRRSAIASNSALENNLKAPIATRGWGGGLYIADGALETQEALFLNNDAQGADSSGGAIKLLNSQARLRGGEISGNQAGQGGGGVDVLSGTTTLMNIALRRNSAADGSGILLRPADTVSTTSALTLTNVLLAEHSGAALALLARAGGAAHAEMRHTTLISNSVGVRAGAGQSVSIVNSLLIGNEIAAQALDGGVVTLDHTDRYSNRLNAEGDVRIGPAGDMRMPPGFAPGDTEFRLALESPLRDRGALLAGISGDFEGQPRSADGDGDGVARPDLGWDELVRSAAQFGPDPTLFAPPGQALTTTLDLRNLGLAGDTFQISITSPAGWSANTLPAQVTLGSRTRMNILVGIAVPSGARLNSQEWLEVRAAGRSSAATARILVVVSAP